MPTAIYKFLYQTRVWIGVDLFGVVWICSPPNIDKVIDNSGEEAKLSKVNSGNLWFFDTSDDKGRGV